MSIPILIECVGGVNIKWSDYPFIARVRQIHAHKDGRVTAELTIYLLENDQEKLLYPTTQINMVAERTRQSLAKSIEAQASSNYPWQEIVYQICQKVLEHSREGEPVQEMWSGIDGEELKPPSYLLDPLVLEELPNVIFGKPGSLKSTLALSIASILILKVIDNPLKLYTNGREVRTLYLDWEVGFKALQYQLARLQQGMELPPVMINYRRCYLPLAQDIEQTMLHIDKARAELLIIDSLAPATGGELKEAAPALEFFAALRKLKISSLILAHTSHDEEAKEKKIYGSVFFEAQARNIWEVRKVAEAGDSELDIALFHNKPPPFAAKHIPLGYHILFEPNKTIITAQDARSVPEFVERMGNNQRILAALKSGKMQPKELAELLKINPASVRTSLKRLAYKQLVVKMGEDYGLPL